jgi:hypothetical protein
MSLTIGRTAGLALRAVQQSAATELTLRCTAHGATQDEIRAIVQQVAGLVDTTQPVICSEEPHLDGFYEIIEVQFERSPGLWDQQFWAEMAVRARRVAHAQTPGCSWIVTHADRDGKPGAVTAQPWHAVPATRRNFDVGTNAIVYYYPRTGPGGTVHWMQSAAVFADARPRGQIDPANWWDMSPTLRLGNQIVVGDQIPILTSLSSWSADNGLIKIEASATSNCLMKVTFPASGGSTWGTPQDLEVGYYDGATWRPQTNLVGIKVMRADPEELRWRLVVRVKHPLNALVWDMMIDLRLRRGSLLCETQIVGGRSERYGMAINGAPATTAFPSNEGCYRTANDSDGNRILLISADALATGVLTTGQAYLAAAAKRWRGAVGCNLGGSGASTPNKATDVRDQYFAAGGSTIMIGS